MDNFYGVFLGMAFDKHEHHAAGLDPAGNRLRDVPLPNSEPKPRAIEVDHSRPAMSVSGGSGVRCRAWCRRRPP